MLMSEETKFKLQETVETRLNPVSYTHLDVYKRQALRLGMAFSSRPVIDILNKVKPPYNINQATQDLALAALENIQQVNEWIKITVSERDRLSNLLTKLPLVKKVYPSDANFILAQVDDALGTYNLLAVSYTHLDVYKRQFLDLEIAM